MRPNRSVIVLVLAFIFLQIQWFQLLLRYLIFFTANCQYQRLQNQLFVLISERRQLKLRARRRRCRLRYRQSPYMWVLPKPVESWFEINHHNRTLPDTVFRKKLRMNRETFDKLLDVLRPSITRQDTIMRDCVPPEKVLAIGLYRLAHGNSYESMAPALNVGRTTAIEAVQDVVNQLYELRNHYIKFPVTAAEIAASIETFAQLSELPNVVGAIDGTHIRINAPRNSAVDYFSRYQSHDSTSGGFVCSPSWCVFDLTWELESVSPSVSSTLSKVTISRVPNMLSTTSKWGDLRKCPPDWLRFQSFAFLYLSIRYRILRWHFSTSLFSASLDGYCLLSSSAILLQYFLASWLSIPSWYCTHNCTSNSSSWRDHLSYDFFFPFRTSFKSSSVVGS